ncbi:protein FAR1-RELATED SEQUENCE 6-like [Tripterygium wilfordii]|uniref:protein FAR1-RELATED SEQUENCE 6-like n=1 Tax=Tripterygium wilfordii TaxID=458696 RepID=UPI0018F8592F|nr:protein FAR1-RELATED SEQUENCE 6-like [Tripterygium wilfordii]
MSKNFQFRVIKSTKTLFMIQCAAKGCEWRMRSIRVKDSELFKVTRLNDNHKCSLDFINRSHMQASGKVIGECIKSKYNGVGRIYRPKDIIQDVRQEFGVNISYDKAWRAREAALESVRGTPEDSFSYLPHYCAELEKNNPGTITYIESDHEKRFKYFFMALGASLRGFWSAMRPVIAVDGTHLKGKYMGTLFVAAAQDGNKKIYPVAFGVGDSENNASWEWFFEKLRVALALEDFSELSLISDRHKSIERGVSLVFPESYHGHCMHHIKQNMKAKKIDDAVFPIYFKAAKAYRISDFEHLMTQIRGFEGGKAYKYLEDAGFDKWSRAHFPGYILTTNIAESMNAALRDVRGLPITMLVEQLRSLIQRWFHERRTKAASITSQLCKKVEKKMTKRNERALRMLVEPSNFSITCTMKKNVNK